MAIPPLSHSETKSEPLQDSVVREESSASEMAELEGRLLVGEAAAGARMNKGKIVKIVAVSVLVAVLLTAAVVCMACHAGPKIHASLGSDNFLMVCVVTHLTTICLLANFAATAPTPAARRHYADSIIASSLHLAANLYFAVVARPRMAQAAA